MPIPHKTPVRRGIAGFLSFYFDSSSPSAMSPSLFGSQQQFLPLKSSVDDKDDQVVFLEADDDRSDKPEFGHEHYSQRGPWLRAALLGANDGLISTASLIMGAAGADSTRNVILLTGLAGLVAGALSMACGEFVSIAGQRDAEVADMRREKAEFLKGEEYAQRELEELAGIYEARGLSSRLAMEVAKELHEKNDLDGIVKIHMRDELAIDTDDLSNPWLAAIVSALSFSMGALLPLLGALIAQDPKTRIVYVVAIATISLGAFGMIGAKVGGAPQLPAAIRVMIGGLIAMIGTYGIGVVFTTVNGNDVAAS
ncbi:VIT family-domain-containing protein [Polychytrium aggregatum]|uniref:VIT family-domain-containing protein n=1 Tax=Polychytrium aggregatum TaxID=110093 RepID=UPI0022FEB3D0|nr:VIT family-domain-containing protein [Polychytrium aggregatum]KAI9204838.1 VIT family-domain-containing protein [Polychytrium aggregatum]